MAEEVCSLAAKRLWLVREEGFESSTGWSATHLGCNCLQHLACASEGSDVDAAETVLLLGDARRLLRLNVVKLAEIPRAQVVRVLGRRAGVSRASKHGSNGEWRPTWIVTMSSLLKTESSMRSRQLLVLMQSRSIESYAKTLPDEAMKTMWVWGVKGLKVTGSAYVPDGVLKKLSLMRSAVASGRPVTGSGQRGTGLGRTVSEVGWRSSSAAA